MNERTEQVVKALRDAATKIETGYWYRGRYGSNGPQDCTVTTDGVVHPGANSIQDADGNCLEGGCLVTAILNSGVAMKAREAIKMHLGLHPHVPDLAVYQINDSQPVETGRDWAISVYRNTADQLERGEMVLGGDIVAPPEVILS